MGGTRVTEPGVLGLEQHGGQSYGLYFIFLAFMYVLRCISLNINSQHITKNISYFSSKCSNYSNMSMI